MLDTLIILEGAGLEDPQPPDDDPQPEGEPALDAASGPDEALVLMDTSLSAGTYIQRPPEASLSEGREASGTLTSFVAEGIPQAFPPLPQPPEEEPQPPEVEAPVDETDPQPPLADPQPDAEAFAGAKDAVFSFAVSLAVIFADDAALPQPPQPLPALPHPAPEALPQAPLLTFWAGEPVDLTAPQPPADPQAPVETLDAAAGLPAAGTFVTFCSAEKDDETNNTATRELTVHTRKYICASSE